ncbi:hypothetical protein LCGC14_0624650 [marine sediment metagenome]|uniref:Uncharacterized protein n=1 Tax=marine sediment metagenome TaxID=412755 RepID=A0A0F9R3R8_9ZZZZ
MAINIRIDPAAYAASGPLAQFATREIPNTYPKLHEPLLSAVTGTGYIASAPRLTGSSNILDDGSFPTAEGATGTFEAALPVDTTEDIVVHVSPTSGSAIVRGGSAWDPNQAEFDPSYGLDVGIAGVTLQGDVFETALKEPVGMQFRANLQDYVARGILIVTEGPTGPPMDPGEIADYTAP